MVVWSALLGVYALLQLFAVGYLRASITWKTLGQAVLVGLYTCTVAAYPLEAIAVHLLDAGGVSGSATIASYTVDPAIEEVVKAAPLVFIAVRVGGTLGIIDMVFLGAATGLGFRLAEEWLRLTRGIDPHLPAPGALLGWLPPGQESNVSIDWGGQRFSLQVAGALVWTAIGGLGIGLARRIPGPVVLRVALPLAVLAWVSSDHALVNFTQAHATGSVMPAADYPGPLRWLFLLDGFGGAMRYYLLAGVLVALWLDSRRVARLVSAEPGLRLPDEKPRASLTRELRLLLSALGKGRGYPEKLARLLRLRRQLAYGGDAPDGALRDLVVASKSELDAPLPSKSLAQPRKRGAPVTLASLSLWAGFLIVFVLGTAPVVPQPWRVQHLLASPVTPALFAAGVFLAVRSLRRYARVPVPAGGDGEMRVRHELRGLLTYGVAGAVALGLSIGLSRGAAGFLTQGGAHLYEAAQETLPVTLITGAAPGLKAADADR